MKNKNVQLNKLGIIGGGRFAEVLIRLLGDDFSINVFDKNIDRLKNLGMNHGINTCNNLSGIIFCDVVIFAVPISAFESVFKEYSRIAPPDQLMIDVLSVKSFPKKIFKKVFKNKKQNFIFTHPMFGPDSSKNGFGSLPIMLDGECCVTSILNIWKCYFAKKGLSVVEMSCEEHDKLAANSQGLSHLVGRVLGDLGLEPTNIDTLGSKKLLEVRDLVENDSQQLFLDLQRFNPYTKKMRKALLNSFKKVIQKI